jgi:alpha-maltose-1-phosphate synthase
MPAPTTTTSNIVEKANGPARFNRESASQVSARARILLGWAQPAVKTLLLTNEYPPHVYGGAGVHVEFLSRELARLMDVEVRCFGEQREDGSRLHVKGFPEALDVSVASSRLRPALGALGRNLAFTAEPVDADVVHCHTWYSHLGGILVKLAYGIPLVVTVHSLEPLRPWKREQLGGGYDVSTWV